MIIGIDHVQIAIPKGGEAVAREFYRTTLGFEEIEKPEGIRDRGGCWFRKNMAVLHLGVDQSFIPARKAHPAFIVRDIDTFRRTLEQRQVSIIDDTSLPHVRRFFVFDPFGNRIEFLREGDAY
jgi:catechol 2,3-dioxygenase-like lactoylglutathione lyase family enzyme